MPAPSLIDWPEDVLGCAARVGYNAAPAALFRILTVQDGPARYRLVQDEVRVVYSMTFNWSAAQLMAFTQFFHETLDAGAAWFNMNVLTGVGVQKYLCHFTDSHTLTESSDRPGLFIGSFTVEAYAAGVVPPATFVPGDPVDARTPDDPSVDIYDARTAGNPADPNRVNSLSPVAFT